MSFGMKLNEDLAIDNITMFGNWGCTSRWTKLPKSCCRGRGFLSLAFNSHTRRCFAFYLNNISHLRFFLNLFSLQNSLRIRDWFSMNNITQYHWAKYQYTMMTRSIISHITSGTTEWQFRFLLWFILNTVWYVIIKCPDTF